MVPADRVCACHIIMSNRKYVKIPEKELKTLVIDPVDCLECDVRKTDAVWIVRHVFCDLASNGPRKHPLSEVSYHIRWNACIFQFVHQPLYDLTCTCAIQ